MNKPVYLSAREAAVELGVQPATLYAYVSRGLIKSVPGPGKQRRYDASDVRRLVARKEEDRPESGTPGVAPGVITYLTFISEADGPFYRGRSAAKLARSSSLETVATLLWGGEADDPFASPPPVALQGLPSGLSPLDSLTMALAAWPLQDRAAYTLSPKLLREKGAALLRYMVSALLRSAPGDAPIHAQVLKAWNIPPSGADVIRAALVLTADHELNTSAFAVRCAASTRAPLHAALLAGLGTFSGPRHGAAADRVTAWLSQVQSGTDLGTVLEGRLARGEDLPGFGHRIYPARDPRADCLLQILRATVPEDGLVQRIPDILDLAEALFGLAPNIDFALAVTERSLGLPQHAAKTVFCMGRTVGWIAHALEQYQDSELIRPRATYLGDRPR
ncbi:citrate synthase [Roseibium aquae]|uniref:citrate synthase (unknown stereospecificity) n=1 Tax=Roseibium aquae TaxID=1323746 RepID=A0A916TET4_9HYPH|nr:citrate synthase family protein [Roseibium aquae]GGB40910.1 citrate synthase [Roseibium aquae]